MTAILEAAVKDYQRRSTGRSMTLGMLRLKADPEKWADYQKEIEAWDVTLADGLEGY